MLEWFNNIDKIIELVAAVLSLLYLYLEVKENAWLWLVGIISSALYSYVYFASSFYADFGLMVYYVVVSIFGWIHWHRGGVISDNTNLPIQRLTLKLGFVLLIWLIFIYGLLLLTLLYLPGYIGLSSSSFPYVDSLTVAASILGTWMLTRKILEQWLVWIVVNIICVFMYWMKDLNFTTILFIIYSIGSVVGYIKWTKNYQLQIRSGDD